MKQTDAYRRYLLVVLVVTLALNAKDRLLFGLSIQAIKTDLSLSDTQLGLLTGIAFALFYALMGIPIGRLADRGNRSTIIAVSTVIWSGAVALCGIAASFVHLLILRTIVAVGEAGFLPPAHSLLADYFDRAHRPRAMAIFKLGVPLSALFGYFLAGWLLEEIGWRATFVVLGAPGVLVALIIWLTIEEPRSSLTSTAAIDDVAVGAQRSDLLQVTRDLWINRTFRSLLFGFSIISFFANGISQWQPAFIMRSFGMGTAELGLWLTIVYGVFGLLGTYIGGYLATRFAGGNERLQLVSAAAVYVLFGIGSVAIYLAPSAYVAIGLMGVSAFGVFAVSGPLFATIQSIVAPDQRATAIAILMFCVSLIGLGLGPLAVGVISDLLAASAGKESLRYALMSLSPGYLLGAWFYWRASQTANDDLAALDSRAAQN